MEEIEVGEYVRTKEGYIRKIGKIEKCEICKENLYINIEIIEDLHFTNSYHTKDITKHSKNIIDLIEEGDYVNGIKVTGIMCGYVYLDKIDIETKKVKTLTDYQIKDIVTKEQFNSIAYRLEE